jgi:hypothetical protein
MHVFRFEADGGTGEMRQMLRKGDRDRPIELTLKGRWDELSKSEPDDGGLANRISDARVDAPSETKTPVELQLAMPPSPTKTPGTGTYIAAGVGVLALSSFAYFGLAAQSDATDMRNTCKPNCPADRVDAARSKLVVANVSLGVVIAAFGVAGALWLLQPQAPQQATSLRFDVVPAERGHGASVLATVSGP